MTSTSIPVQPDKQRESIRLFENDILERLSHVHPITPLLIWAPIAGWLFWRSVALADLNVSAVVAAALAGIFVWTLSEYCLHRYLFHFPARSRPGKWRRRGPSPSWRYSICCSGLSYRNPGCSHSAAASSSAT